MKLIIDRLEKLFQAIPLSFLEIWGRLGFLVGFFFMVCAFAGVRLKSNGKREFAVEKYSWDANSLRCMMITFVSVLLAGVLGSRTVLVPGAQTLESLKDLSVFLCIVLFGYPALLVVPFAYALSDLYEGVPPQFIFSWALAYFINPACFWVAHLFIGRNPDFRHLRTWALYVLFTLIFMTIEPILWGYVCSNQFTPEISYRTLTPALFFTTSITWLLAPLAMLVALPIIKKFGLFWADSPARKVPPEQSSARALPYRMFLAGTLIAVVLSAVAATAYVTLRSGEVNANILVRQLHEEVAANIQGRLEDFIAGSPDQPLPTRIHGLQDLLATLPIAKNGRAFIIDRTGKVIASSHEATTPSNGDPIIALAVKGLIAHDHSLLGVVNAVQFPFPYITNKPLARETWLAQATPFLGPKGARTEWILFAAMPETYYLAGVRTGHSQSAMIFALAIFLTLAAAALLGKAITAPIQKISEASEAIAAGNLAKRIPGSRFEELNSLARSFNLMTHQLEKTFHDLYQEATARSLRERDLRKSETQLQESQARLKMAIQAANLGIWDWDIIHDRLVWDDGMFRQYGIKSEDFEGTSESWKKRLLEDDLPDALRAAQRALEGQSDYVSEFRVPRSDGTERTIRSYAQVIRDDSGKAIRMVGLNHDITESRQFEDELRKSRDEALEAFNVKSEFLANMSHELRTPLNSLLGLSSLLGETKLDEEQKKLLNVLEKSGDHLLRIINDILDLTVLESKAMTLSEKPMNLREIVESSSLLLSEKAKAKGIQLSWEVASNIQTYYRGDAQRIRQILINLLDNAIKFTDYGSVKLNVSSPSHSGGLLFAVTDTGIGIPKEKRTAIFERFTQANASVTKKYGGSGLGLSISNQLVKLMGGELKVESVEEVGSTFSFELALHPCEAPVKESIQPETANARPLQILVVDDSEDNLLLVEHYLKKTPFRMDSAENGEQAIGMFLDKHYDLIFMDIQMPIMDGYTATRAIRVLEKQKHLARVPIAALTAYALKEEEKKSFEAGCDFHLTKPVTKHALLETISRLAPA